MEFQTPRAPLLRTTSGREAFFPRSGASSALQTPFTLDTEEWIVFSPSIAGDTLSTLADTNQLASVSAHPVEDHEESQQDDGTDSLAAFEAERTGIMLPTHDGLGSFASMGASLEESLKAVGEGQSEDKNDRIQRWRAQQGEAIMVEIEKESRRRQRRLSIISRKSEEKAEVEMDTALDGEATMANLPDVKLQEEEEVKGEAETFWKRITRTFIRDIIGIDDHLLEVIFGEALPVEALGEPEERQTRSSEERILDRIAKELGELVHLYTHPPSGAGGAFLAQRRLREEGEGRRTPGRARTLRANATSATRPSKRQRNASFDSTASSIKFTPTLTLRQQEDAYHAALWGIEEDNESVVSARIRQDYWEQDLDLRLVFSYLKSRFTAPSRTSIAPPPSSTPTTPSSPLNQRPLGRQPLYRRQSATSSKHTTSGTGYFGKVGPASCASQDRRSKNSSRNYWDIATSVGSGQAGSCVGTGVWAAI